MPTTRKRRNRNLSSRITPAAVEAFRVKDYLALFQAIHWRPWKPSPLDADLDGDIPDHLTGPHVGWWLEAQEVRAALIEAVNAD